MMTAIILAIFSSNIVNAQAENMENSLNEQTEGVETEQLITDENSEYFYISENEIPEEFLQYLKQEEYEVRCVQDENGVSTWYLINNVEGSRIKISDLNVLVSEAEAKNEEILDLKSDLKITKIISIIIIGILVIALMIFISFWRKEKLEKALLKHQRKINRREIEVDDYEDNGATKY